ncbi:Vmc-like lipoprotein signal peptide domain-containing protein [Spiroplasma endosymbiont of Aspidapion aeneum]|uniref:Vmc-like lipoprotein signal peptide domain-containing protein n=1 Tax=Spiroplasma endosymbiont of Aspidapion aeneum TaxID=3066276 RepID=UPI00313B5478
MKKLIALLSSLSLISTSATITVSCNKYEQTSSDGDSILVNFLEQIGENGISTITASDVLYKLVSESNSASRQTFVNDFTNLLDISFLSGSKDGGSLSKLYNNEDSPYYSSTLIKSMQQAFSNINSSADSQIERERATYKSDYGWRWSGKWRDYLAGKFPLYQSKSKNADVGFLEKKYKASLMLTSADYSASSTLQKFLLNTDQFGVTWVEKDEVRTKLQSFAIATNQDSWVSDNKQAATQIWNSQYSYLEGPDKWVNESSTDVTAENIKAKFINSDDNSIKIDQIISAVPSDVSQFTSSDSIYRTGYLSNTQKYFAEKWYETKAPLATSFIKFPFATNASFDKGISKDSFSGLNDIEAKEINKFLSDAFVTPKTKVMNKDEAEKSNEDVDKNWKTLMSNSADISKKYTDATATINSTLLTLSNSADYEQDVRSAIYDYVFKKNHNETTSSNNQEIDLSSSGVDDGLKAQSASDELYSKVLMKIDRSKDGNMYASIKGAPGYIAIITSNGLIIYHIDGYDQLLASVIASDKSEKKSKYIDTTKEKIDTDTLKELQAFKKFSDMNDLEKVTNIQVNKINPDDKTSTYNLLNGSISNQYLKWLLNNSLLSSTAGSATKFDIMKTVKTWANQTDKPSTTGEYEWTTYIIDYFKNIIVDSTTKTTYSNADFIGKFIVFSAEDKSTKTKELSKNLGDWYANALDSIDSVIASNSSQSFTKAYNTWKKTLNEKTDDAYPKGVLNQDSFKDSELPPIVGSIWWMPTKNN